jgi:hypothetical protein
LWIDLLHGVIRSLSATTTFFNGARRALLICKRQFGREDRP